MACVRDEDLANITALPDDDPVRCHVMGCARCRARWLAYQEFADPSALPIGANPEEAAVRLGLVIDSQIIHVQDERGTAGPNRKDATQASAAAVAAATESVVAGTGAGEGSSRLERMLRRLWLPAMRPVWAVGLLVLIIVGAQEIRRSGPSDHRPGQGPIVLRDSRGAGVNALTPGEPARLPDGGIALSWNTVPGADRYEVTLHGEDLQVKARFAFVSGAEPGASVTIPAATINELTAAGQTLFWRVTAYRGGDSIASSPMRQLSVPATR